MYLDDWGLHFFITSFNPLITCSGFTFLYSMLCPSHSATLSSARSRYSVLLCSWYMMCSVVVVVVIVVAAAAQPFWKPAELHVGPNISLTSDTAWLLSHIIDPSLRRKDGSHRTQ